jgi:hypothetical protein
MWLSWMSLLINLSARVDAADPKSDSLENTQPAAMIMALGQMSKSPPEAMERTDVDDGDLTV